MCEVQKLFDALFKTMASAKANRRCETMKLVNELRCCSCCHEKRINMAAESTKKPQVPQKIEKKVLVLCGALLGLIPIATVFLARHYNHSQTHGSGACVSTLLYTSTDCEVIF
ncbi:uncharacterized protein LOC117901374 [Drosophila subobscura]|uniref:uncharacterized protein LOC117901374 n=1 Tax=Drosophila subobscura TaxID=7241 RepID=UPI00155A9769|nr:uncharacterized protein LOC117901374 [Drosophila subobscura]